MYLLLVPPIAVAIALLVIGFRRRSANHATTPVDAMDAHRRCLEALDPRAASRKAAQQALQDGPQSTSRIHRHA